MTDKLRYILDRADVWLHPVMNMQSLVPHTTIAGRANAYGTLYLPSGVQHRVDVPLTTEERQELQAFLGRIEARLLAELAETLTLK